MNKNFQLNGRVGGKLPDFGKRQLPGQHRAGKAQVLELVKPRQRLDRHLRGCVQGHSRRALPRQPRYAEILRNQGIDTAFAAQGDHVLRIVQLLIPYQRIKRQVHLDIALMTIVHCPLQRFIVKISGITARVEQLPAQVNGIGPAAHRSGKRVHRPGGGKDFSRM